MIPEFLQDELIKEIKNIFSKDTFKSRSGADTELNVFAQSLPQDSNREDDFNEPFPYVIVRLVSGTSEDFTTLHKVEVFLIIGMYYENKDKQGYREVLNIINRVRERFRKNRLLGDSFLCVPPDNWSLQDEDSHPYYFGGIELNFEIPEIVVEDDLS